MKAVGNLVRNSENQAVEVTVLRKDVELAAGTHTQRLSLRPQRWEGAGLLGCLLKPVVDTPTR